MGETCKGRCLCGASEFEFIGKMKFAIRCFCTDCQHVSGGGHLPQAGVSSEGWQQSGPIKTFEKAADSGSTLGFSFCGECGSPLFKTTSKMPDTVFVMAGALEDARGADFSARVFEERRAAWDQS